MSFVLVESLFMIVLRCVVGAMAQESYDVIKNSIYGVVWLVVGY